MRLPDDTNKFSHNWKYYELGRLYENRVVREQQGPKGQREPKFFTLDQIPRFRKKYDNTGLYISVYAFNKQDIETSTRLAPLFFDLDAEDLEESLSDAKKLISFFGDMLEPSAIRLYFSGKKGFHIELEPLALGITGQKDLKSVFREIATDLIKDLDLTTVDLRVYDDRRMWRLANSIHQKTGLYKTHLPQDVLFSDNAIKKILEWATVAHTEDVPEQKLNIRAASWFREYNLKLEKAKQMREMTLADRFKLLNKQGSNIVHQFNNDDLEFDPVKAFEGCKSLLRLWKKAETTHHLEHEERLFLCSLLTYSQEAIEYLYAILRNCDDFDEDRSRHHIDDWIARREAGIGGRPYSCKSANQKGVGCGDCDLEPRKRYSRVGDVVVETEEYADPSPIRYIYTRRNNDRSTRRFK